MTTTAWFFMVEVLPTDASTVWVRMNTFIEVPFQAVWDLATATFTNTTTGLTLPWYQVVRWREL